MQALHCELNDDTIVYLTDLRASGRVEIAVCELELCMVLGFLERAFERFVLHISRIGVADFLKLTESAWQAGDSMALGSP